MIYFSAVRLVADDFATFSNVHHVNMAFAFVMAIWAALETLRLSEPSSIGFIAAALCAPVMLYLIGGALTTSRFDALAAVFAALGILQAVRQRPILAAILIGVGASIKVWPIFLVPFLLPPGSPRRQLLVFARTAIIALATAAAAHLFWAPFGTRLGDLLGYLEFASARPMHTESMVLLLSRSLGYMNDAVAFVSYGSHNWVGGTAVASPSRVQIFFLLFAGLMVLAVAYISTKPISRPELMRLQASLRVSVIALLMCASTFFSVEYTVWLVPLVLAVARPWQWVTLSAMLVAAASTKVSYNYYDSIQTMDATGQAISAVKWATITMLFVIAILALVSALRVSRSSGPATT